MGEARVLTQVGFLTPPPPPSSPSRRTALRESPQELLCFPNLQGWGGAGGFLSGLREKALKEGRRKEQPAATKGFKGLGPLPNGLPQPSAAQRGQPGPGLPAPPPPCGQGHSSSGLPPRSAGQPGEGRGFPCSPGSCHPRRKPGNASASCPAPAGRGQRKPTQSAFQLGEDLNSAVPSRAWGLGRNIDHG